MENTQTGWHLKIAYFLIAHQIMLQRMALFGLILINVIIWSSTIIRWTDYLTTAKQYQATIASISKNLINFDQIKMARKPMPVQILLTAAVPSHAGRYDFLAKVKNDNLSWAVTKIKYRFTFSNGQTELNEDFIMPGQEKYLFAFLQKTSANPTNVNLIIEDTQWLRLANQNISTILNEIDVGQESFSRFDSTSQVNFTVSNGSAFNFWQAGWQVVLYQGSKPIAANYTTANQFLSLSTVPVQSTWFQSLPSPSKIDIISDIDVLSANNLINVSSGSGIPKGVVF